MSTLQLLDSEPDSDSDTGSKTGSDTEARYGLPKRSQSPTWVSREDEDEDEDDLSEDYVVPFKCWWCEKCNICENCKNPLTDYTTCQFEGTGDYTALCVKCFENTEIWGRFNYPNDYRNPEEDDDCVNGNERKDSDYHRYHHEYGDQNQRILGHICSPRVIVPGRIPENPYEIFRKARRTAKKLLWTLFIWVTKASLFDGIHKGEWVAGFYDPKIRHIFISVYCTANMKEILLALLHEAMHSFFHRISLRIQRNLYTDSEEEGLCEVFSRYLECWNRGEKEPSLENYTTPAYDKYFYDSREKFFPDGVSFGVLKRFIEKLLKLKCIIV